MIPPLEPSERRVVDRVPCAHGCGRMVAVGEFLAAVWATANKACDKRGEERLARDEVAICDSAECRKRWQRDLGARAMREWTADNERRAAEVAEAKARAKAERGKGAEL